MWRCFHGTSPRQDGATACIGSAAPYLVTNKKSVVQPAAGSGAFQPFTSNVSRLLMSSFVGMQVGGEGNTVPGCTATGMRRNS